MAAVAAQYRFIETPSSSGAAVTTANQPGRIAGNPQRLGEMRSIRNALTDLVSFGGTGRATIAHATYNQYHPCRRQVNAAG